MTWQDAYKLPLKLWGIGEVKVFTADNSMAFDFMFEMFYDMYPKMKIIPGDSKLDVIALINGEKKGKVEGEVTYNQKEQTIDVDGQPILLIRGWGHLTGTGGLNLQPEQAAFLQDQFGQYIADTLSGR